jgi:putative sporulation protein YtxC
LLTILFEDRDEAMFVYERLLIKKIASFHYMKVKLEESKVIVSCKKHVKTCLKNIIVPTLVEFVVTIKEAKWMSSLLQKQFYYEDEVEIDHIIEIAKDILYGKQRGDVELDFISSRKKKVANTLENFLSFSVSFSIEAFFQFRLKSYIHHLLLVTQRAIDEYQLEQEYQVFIDELRTKVNESEGKLSVVHVVYDGGFTLYDNSYQLIEGNMMDKIDEEMEIDTDVLAPLVYLSPHKVYLYAATIDVPLIVTVMNVFQDRVKVRDLQDFWTGRIQQVESGKNEEKYTKELDF